MTLLIGWLAKGSKTRFGGFAQIAFYLLRGGDMPKVFIAAKDCSFPIPSHWEKIGECGYWAPFDELNFLLHRDGIETSILVLEEKD